MNLIRIILWAVIIYLIFSTIRNLFRYLSSAGKSGKNGETKKKKQGKYKIEKEDVIEAHFEEIDPSKSDNQKDNN
ncbi:MAG: hypothetical protein CVV24_12895 [Ignavibacteriae bacterium HGW-Ignavibacteriae-3]|nr:MAG: hypothetical protein CVV24_12895 [Ignavibacteriae bacterium HGW-Ignavibacteriae-3]